MYGNFPMFDLENLAVLISNWLQYASAIGDAVLPQQEVRIYEQLCQGKAVLITTDSFVPVGFLTGYYLGTDSRDYMWHEIGSGYIVPEYRGRGLANELYAGICRVLPGSVLVGTTKNEAALKASLQAGFRQVLFSSIPKEIRQGLCYDASCFRPVRFSRKACVHEHVPGQLNSGCCVARVKYPHW